MSCALVNCSEIVYSCRNRVVCTVVSYRCSYLANIVYVDDGFFYCGRIYYRVVRRTISTMANREH